MPAVALNYVVHTSMSKLPSSVSWPRSVLCHCSSSLNARNFINGIYSTCSPFLNVSSVNRFAHSLFYSIIHCKMTPGNTAVSCDRVISTLCLIATEAHHSCFVLLAVYMVDYATVDPHLFEPL